MAIRTLIFRLFLTLLALSQVGLHATEIDLGHATVPFFPICSITGKVVDEAGKGVVGADVTLPRQNRADKTTVEGYFLFTHLECEGGDEPIEIFAPNAPPLVETLKWGEFNSPESIVITQNFTVTSAGTVVIELFSEEGGVRSPANARSVVAQGFEGIVEFERLGGNRFRGTGLTGDATYEITAIAQDEKLGEKKVRLRPKETGGKFEIVFERSITITGQVYDADPSLLFSKLDKQYSDLEGQIWKLKRFRSGE